MILVDSSVWVDYFGGKITPQTTKLDQLLVSEPVAIGDLILAEILQGFTDEREFTEARKLPTSLIVVDLCRRHCSQDHRLDHRHLVYRERL